MSRHQKGCDLEETGVRLELLDWQVSKQEGKGNTALEAVSAQQELEGMMLCQLQPHFLHNIHHDYREWETYKSVHLKKNNNFKEIIKTHVTMSM